MQGRKQPDEALGSIRSAPRTSSQHHSDRDRIDLKLALLDRGVELVSYVLAAQPNRSISTRRTLRWGKKGAFAYEASGPKRGSWFDHEASEGGDLLGLIKQRIIGRDDFAEALRWARQWLGWPIDGPAPIDTKRDARRQAQAEKLAKDEAEEAKDRRRRIASAARIWKRTIPVSGTLAGRYVRETRCIPIETWPLSVRLDPVENALVLMAEDDTGAFLGVQLVRLTASATKIEGDGRKLVKQSYGVLMGAAVRLPGDEHGPIILAEGPETGLSVWAATGFETWIALGSMAKLSPPMGRTIIVARDDDPKDGGAWKGLSKAITEWRETGREVFEAHPWETRRADKSDFNDVIRALGPEAVRARFNLVIDEPLVIGQRLVRLGEARATLDRRVAEFTGVAKAWAPGSGNYPVHGIGVTLGTGKTETALRHAKTMLLDLRAAGDDRAVVMAVPEHRLSAEIKIRAQTLGISNIAIWRGREARLPGGEDGATMCGNLNDVRLAQRLYADVADDVCKTCPLRDGCAYLAQRDLDADLWIVGHPIIFHAAPQAIGKRGAAALIVDESPWQAGLIGIEGAGIEIALDELDPGVLPVPDGDGPSGGARLEDLRQRVKFAVTSLPDGPVRRDALKDAGFDADSGAVARRLEWQRKVEEGPWRERDANLSLGQMNALWNALHALMQPDGPEISGWLTLGRSEALDAKVRVLKVTGRRDVGADWHVPTLLIDANLDETLVRPYWPQIQVTARVEVETPHMRVRQVASRTYSKSMLAPRRLTETEAHEKDERARRKARERIGAYIAKVDRERDGRTLFVSNKAIVEALDLPEHIERAHFNAVAGRDIWGDVASIIVVGRPQPSPQAAERIAGALTGAAPLSIGTENYYPRADVNRLQKVAGVVQLVHGQAAAHPDATVERIRHRIAEGEVMQAIGRGRGVNRTAANELEVIVLGDGVLPIPVDEFLPDEAVQVGPSDLMLAKGGIAFTDAAAAADAYPGLWSNSEAARKALQRQKCGTISYREFLIGECPALPRTVTVTYRRAGQGQRQAQAVVDLRVHPDPKAALELKLGNIAYYVVVDERGDPVEAVIIDFPAKAPLDEVILAAESYGEPHHQEAREEPIVIDLDAVRMAVRDGAVLLGTVAREIGISLPHLSNAIHGRRQLKPDVEARLAQIAATIQPIQGRLL